MLTLPTEISNNKDKTSIKPVLLLELYDIPYHIASKYYKLTVGSGTDGVTTGTTTFTSATATFETWGAKPGDIIYIDDDGAEYVISSVDSETQVTLTSVPSTGTGLTWEYRQVYYDLMKGGVSLSLTNTIPQLVNGLSSVSGAVLPLLDWRGTLRGDIIGSTPDLTNSETNLYLKFDTSSAAKSGALKIYSGVVATYSIKRDVMTLRLKGALRDYGLIPGTALSSTYPDADFEENQAEPLQYGDFSWTLDPRYYDDFDSNFHGLALVPYVGLDSSGSKQFHVASHQMHNMPTATDLTDLYGDSYFFLRRDNKWVIYSFTGTPVVSNSSSGCTITGGTSDYCYTLEPPTESHSDGTHTQPTDWAEAVDGKSSTAASVIGSTQRLMIKTINIDNYSENEIIEPGVALIVNISAVTGGTAGNYGNIRIRLISDDSIDTDTQITGIGWYNISTSLNASDVNSYYVTVEPINTATTVEVSAVLWRIRVQGYNPDNDGNFVYLKCQGREYSGTWDSRKTSGNLIENPADVVESIIRDEFGDTDIDTDTFDDANSTFTSVDFAYSFVYQKYWQDILEDLCRAFNFSIVISDIGKWRLIMPDVSNLNFTSSGTGTPGNEDIYTDSPTLSSEEYQQHPIFQGSFELSRSVETDVYGKVTVEYNQNILKRSSTGTGREIVVQNLYIADSTSSTNFRGVIDGWLQNQKWVVRFETFYNAIGIEVGDVINIRHDDLNDSILYATVNTQKWLVVEVRKNWRPNRIEVVAVELLT
ncbi:MAG: hypothetical protein GXO75_15395 [Calditrichaeota bacterium]|nr:hypothetical protein [Calditrichota bacterium]